MLIVGTGRGVCRGKIVEDFTSFPVVKYVTEFWKITHIVVPETIEIFDFTMTLWIAQNPSQIFFENLVILGHFDLLNT